YLYSARVDSTVLTLTEFVRTDPLEGSNVAELHASWAGTFEPTGIFHEDANVYDDAYRGIRACDLRELDHESGSGVFNSFAEILRRHVISDKPNAFNKIFNLFLCKIADEDTKSDKEEMDFQWRLGDSADAFLGRLTHLYSSGLANYIGVRVDP